MHVVKRVLIAVVIAVAIAGCSGPAVTEDEAREAYLVSFISVFSASMGITFGGELPGVTMDKDTRALTFDDFDPSQFAENITNTYTGISGSVSEEDETLVADLKLSGGAVKSIKFSATETQAMSSDTFTNTVTINGKDMELQIGPDDMK